MLQFFFLLKPIISSWKGKKNTIIKPDSLQVTEVEYKDIFLAKLLVLQVGQFSKR